MVPVDQVVDLLHYSDASHHNTLIEFTLSPTVSDLVQIPALSLPAAQSPLHVPAGEPFPRKCGAGVFLAAPHYCPTCLGSHDALLDVLDSG